MPIIGDTTILWYHVGDISDELKNTIEQIPDSLELCFIEDELYEKIARLITLENKILLVFSGNLDNIGNVLPSLSDKKEICGLFIHTNQQPYELSSIQKSLKVYGVFADYESLIERLSKTVRLLIRQQVIINIGNEDIQKCMRDLTKRSDAREVKSNYLHRLHLISGQAKNEYSREDFLKRCRLFYASNQSQLNIIDEFERTYVAEDALKWYTKDSFFFKIINFVLRNHSWSFSSEEMNYFLVDICCQLKEEWKRNRPEVTRSYRGLTLPQNQIDWMTTHVGHTISISAFLSTSKSLDVARMFAENVLFDIELDPTHTDFIYADLSNYTLFEDEEEVLLDFDSTFEITSFQFDETIHLGVAKLVVSNNSEDTIISHLGIRLHEDSSFNDKIRFGQHLRELNRMNKSINTFKSLLNSVQNDIEKFFVYYEIGLMYFIEREFTTSLTYIQVAYDIIKTVHHPDPNVYYNDDQRLIIMGLIYACMQNYDIAFDMFLQSLTYIYWFEVSNAPNNLYYIFIDQLTDVFNSNNQMSLIIGCWLLKDYKTAQKHLESIQNQISNEDYRFLLVYHCFAGLTLLGSGFRVLGYERNMLITAHEHFNQALELAENSKNNSLINMILENLGWLYEEMKHIDSAMECYDVKMRRLDLQYKKNICRIFERVHTIYMETKQFKKAIEYYKTILLKFDDDKKYQAIINEYLGDVYKEGEDYVNAISYYQKSLELDQYEHKFDTDDTIIRKMNTIYEHTKEFQQAIEYYHSILLKFQNNVLLANINACLGDIYSAINDLIYYKKSVEFCSSAQSLTKIHKMYMQTEQFDKAIEYYHTALSQKNINDDDGLVALFNKYLGDSFAGKLDFINSSFYYTKSLELHQNIRFLGDSYDIIDLVDIVYIKTQQYDKAIEYYQIMVSKYLKRGVPQSVASINKCLGDVYRQINDSVNALICYEKSLEFYECDCDTYEDQLNLLYRNIENLLSVEIDITEMIANNQTDINDLVAVRTLNEKLAFSYRRIGKLDLAKKHLHMALNYYENHPKDMSYVDLHMDIGNIEERLENFDDALEHFKTALDLITKEFLDETELQGRLHDKIAYVYKRSGRSRLARYHHKEAFGFYRQCDPVSYLQELNEYESDAESSSANGDYISAIYFTTQSLRFHRKMMPFDYIKISTLLNLIGWFYCLTDQYKKALRFCMNSLKLSEKHSINQFDPEQCYVLHSIGSIHLRTGDDQTAFEYCRKSMNVLEQNNSNLQDHNGVLADIFELFADIYMKRGHHSLAQENYRKSLDKLENMLPKQYLAIERVRNLLEKSTFLLSE